MVDRRLVDDALSSVLKALETSPVIDPADDSTLINDVIGLLATLDPDRVRMSGVGTEDPDAGGVILLAAVVNALVAFVTARCGDSSVLPSRVLARLADSNPYTQLLGEEDERITVATAVAVLTTWTGRPEDRQQMAEDVCRALLDVLASYSDSIVSLFHKASLKEEWRATFAIFADDLRTAAQRMAA